MPEKYRLKEDIDLTRHVRTPAGVAYFHKPIGSPIGGGSSYSLVDGRQFHTGPGGTIPDYEPPKVKAKSGFVQGKDMTDMVERNKRYRAAQRAQRQQGVAATNPAAVFLHQTTVPPASTRPAKAPSNPASDFLHQTSTVKPKRPASMTTQALPKRKKASPAPALFTPKPVPPGSVDVADVIDKSLPDTQTLADAQAWWTKHTEVPIDAAKVKEELGVKFPDLGVRELRRRATDKKSTPEERAAYKAELAHRVHLANQGVAEQDAFIARLTEKLRSKPEDAQIEPLIGETLAMHPKLGPLAHIWDHLRKAGFHIRKEANAEKFVDKAGDVAKGIGTVLLAGLLFHLGGITIPGLLGG